MNAESFKELEQITPIDRRWGQFVGWVEGMNDRNNFDNELSPLIAVLLEESLPVDTLHKLGMMDNDITQLRALLLVIKRGYDSILHQNKNREVELFNNLSSHCIEVE